MTKPTYEEQRQRVEALEAEVAELQANEESEKLLGSVFDAIQDGISILDADLNIIRVNQVMRDWYAHMLPYEGMRKKCFEVYHGKTEPCEACPSIRSLSSGGLEINEVPLVQEGVTKGTLELFAYPIVGESGKVSGIVEHVRDITERKRVEKTLQANEAELEAIVESSAAGITVSDLQGRVLRSNPAHQNMFGYGPDELYKMLFSDFTHTDDIGNHLDHYEEMLAGKRGHFAMQKRFLHKNGRIVWAQVTVSIARDENEKPLFVVGIVEDITERKSAEEEREKLINQLQQAAKEIKTLRGIIPICMYCKQIRDDKGFWNKVESYLRNHTEAEFSHGICPDCLKKYHSNIFEKK